MPKSPDAFRTISEVADWLGVQAHVLRFWESKFSQVKPVKRAGGRRYYRPNDMLLLGGLKKLLHEDGLTIKGAQKMLRENGVAHVAAMSQPLDDLTAAVIDDQVADEVATQPAPEPPAFSAEPAETGEVQPAPELPAATPDAEPVAEPVTEPEEELPVPEPEVSVAAAEPDVSSDAEAEDTAPVVPQQTAPEPLSEPAADAQPLTDAGSSPLPDELEAADTPIEEDSEPDPLIAADDELADAAPAEVSQPDETPIAGSGEPDVESQTADIEDDFAPVETAPEEIPEEDEPVAELPGFLRHPLNRDDGASASPGDTEAAAPKIDDLPQPQASDEIEPSASVSATEPEETAAEPEPPITEDAAAEAEAPETEPQTETEQAAAPEAVPVPRRIDIPAPPAESSMTAEPSALTALSRVRTLTPEQAGQIRPLVARLAQLRADVTGAHKDAGKD
ncbi:MerR family transcriptional regulator [Roseobacter sp. S98]|uniref:MerR family transcriptional regulator n=1 Tax=Roseobacter algicola (ex Choi et al. 2025) (nom. illeg.) TaxID=3092138 RepID=UPI003F512723